jgi:hypothetical protein
MFNVVQVFDNSDSVAFLDPVIDQWYPTAVTPTRDREPNQEDEIDPLEPQEPPIPHQGHNRINHGQVIENLQDNDEKSENTEESYIPYQDNEEVDEDDDEQQFNLPDLEDDYKIRNNNIPTKGNRELKNLGVTQKKSIPGAVRKLHTSYNPTYTDQINMAISSDPGEPTTIKRALIGSDKDTWKEAIKKKEIISYKDKYGRRY